MLRQIELEDKMIESGMLRARRAVSMAEKGGRAHTTVYARRFITSVIEPLIAAIQEWHENPPVRGRGTHVVRLARQVPAEQSALIALSEVMRRLRKADMHAGNSVVSWSMAIGRLIEDEARFSAFGRSNAGFLHELKEDFKKKGTSNYRYMHRVLTFHANQLGETWLAWSQNERMHVGMSLLRLAQESTGVFEFDKVQTKRGTNWVVRASAEFVQWAADCVDAVGVLCPVALPCLVTPDDWISNTAGGYWTPKLRVRFKFVKSNARAGKIVPLESGLATPMRAVNAVQRTPWRINQNVKQALVEVWSKSLGCGLPSSAPLQVPTCPIEGKDKKNLTEEEALQFSMWKREAVQVYTAEHERISKSFQVASAMQLASEFGKEQQIWFPFQVDSRGRMYAVPHGVSPQGPDFSRALLEFANAKRIGAGLDWFFVHGANKLGKDKISYEARSKYMQDNINEWARIANDPIGTRDLWGNADKPWQFLAWCFEARGVLHSGESFESRLPIALDGSCNGLQHFSAMLRDPVGGAATNLIDSDLPADIYREVADVCTRKLMLEDDPLAKMWLDYGVDRSICKKPVMTMPYGSTRQACSQYVLACIMEKNKDFFQNPFKAAVYLTKFIWDSIGEVVVAARAAMQWLRKAATLVSKEHKPLVWTSPSGFQVQQVYNELIVKTIKTTIGDSSCWLRVAEHSSTSMNAYQMRNGASPNFVHSMDAAHLVRTVNAAHARGIQDFACIHDDYGVHAACTPEFFQIIRDEFVSMYSEHNPLEELRSTTMQVSGIELPEAPMYGTLDIHSVLSSRYFFG